MAFRFPRLLTGAATAAARAKTSGGRSAVEAGVAIRRAIKRRK
jgi:hypothetical protein